MTKVRRNLDTEENRQFWADVERAAETVRQWPEWKRRGMAPERSEAMTETYDDFGAPNEVSMQHDAESWKWRIACKYRLSVMETTTQGEIGYRLGKKRIMFDRQEVQRDPELCEERVRRWCGR